MKTIIIIIVMVIAVLTGTYLLSESSKNKYLKESCSIKCGNGSCSASCGGKLTANCNCSPLIREGMKLELPVCGCSTIFTPIKSDLADIRSIDKTFITASKEQLQNIEKFRNVILKDVKPKWLAKRIADDLEIIEFALEHDQVSAYRTALERVINNMEMIEGKE